MTKTKAWLIAAAASALLVAGIVGALFGAGYRFFTVATPSMGTVAPVGTLVAVHPQGSYAVGDVITYARNDRTYTHRIIEISERGLITKGDINDAADPLPVQPNEIVGEVVFTGKYLGFVMRALPWILIGWLLVYALTLIPSVRPSWRWQIRFVGWSLVVTAVAWWQRPWVNLVLLTWYGQSDGVDMHLVNTGIFPVKVLGTVLRSGQDAVVTQTVVDAQGRYTVVPQLALTMGWFLLLLAICLTPMVASLLVRIDDGAVPQEPEPEPATVRSAERLRGWIIGLVVTASVVLVAIVLQWSTQATFSASIVNSSNTAKIRTWLTCRAAAAGTANARFAWDLDALGTQPDISGNGRKGTIRGSAPTLNSSSYPCPRDTPHASLNFNGATCITQGSAMTGGDTYSLEVWFRTSTAANGKLIGFGETLAASDGRRDRHVYIDASGRVLFGTYPYGQRVIASPAGTSYANGQWHHVIATSNAAGVMALYLDGNLVATRSDAAGQESYSGYWKVGCGNLSSWQDANGTWLYNWPNYYTGQLSYAAVYTVALTATQVRDHYLAGVA